MSAHSLIFATASAGDFKGIEMSVFAQTFRHTKGRIARKSAYLYYILRIHHLDEHLQQTTLQMSRRHTPMKHVDIRSTPQTIQIFGFCITMTEDILIKDILALKSCVIRVLCLALHYYLLSEL